MAHNQDLELRTRNDSQGPEHAVDSLHGLSLDLLVTFQNSATHALDHYPPNLGKCKTCSLKI